MLAFAPKAYSGFATERKLHLNQKGHVATTRRFVDFMGHRASIPVQKMKGTHRGSVFTTLLTVDFDKFHFALHTMKTLRETAGVQAFVLLCPSCTREEMRSFQKDGLTPLTIASLRKMVKIAFREGGPMSRTNSSADGVESRRHSPYMLYREWIKFLLLENGIGVLFADVDICYTDSPPPFFTSAADIVVEGYWPNNFRDGSYSFPMLREEKGDLMSVVLNNGHAFFAATRKVREFSRMFMGLVTSEVYEDFGFAQTAFMKTLNTTGLELLPDTELPMRGEPGISGVTKTGMKVEAFQLEEYGHYAVGSDWAAKQVTLHNKKCWQLCREWKKKWKQAKNLDSFFLEC